MKQKKCIIIGAGIGGLAVAVQLATRGHHVLVFEKNDRPGGKIGEIRRSGFRFDTGPSLLTLPHLIDQVLESGHSNEKGSLEYNKLKNVCRYFYNDGTSINAFEKPADFAEEIASRTGEPAKAVLNYLDNKRKLYEASAGFFIFNPFRRLLREAAKSDRAKLKPLLAINPLRSMHAENRRSFNNPHVVQIFDRYATYNGSSPYLASSMLNVISHLEHNTGAYFPEKGMYSIVESVYQKALNQGVEFRFGHEITSLSLKNGMINGVTTRDETFPADIVVSDIDVNTFYRQTGQYLEGPRSVKKPDLSSSAIIFYWAMDREFPGLDLHNILFSGRYREEFDSLFKHEKLFEDPTVYLFISSKTVTSDAPPGCENWFVMINAPAIAQENQEILKNKAREIIINKIKKVLKTDPEPHILFEEAATPRTIQDQTGSYKGALYGNNSNSIWSAFRRHGNHSKKHGNLFFTGGSVHPGGGIPLCLASASIVVNEIEQL